MEKFYLNEYIPTEKAEVAFREDFGQLCGKINSEFLLEWGDNTENQDSILKIQKNAILGYEKEISYFKSKIRGLLKKVHATDIRYPQWYESLEDGIFHENWGMAGMAEWFQDAYKDSSSAKIIGNRIYFLENGKMQQKNQVISKHRREQLKRAILLLSPKERLNKDFHEVYLLDGTRITIFGGSMSKAGEDVIIFRRYIIPNYTFDEQVKRGTIPENAIPLFLDMIKLGYNCAFTGAVRTAKTTFLSTWQRYEDPSLEGVMIETDPEIPLHKIMPDAPIVQLLADNDNLKNISKNLLRSDADYFILAEAREGVALDTAIRIAGKGTRRLKITFHTRDPKVFPYDVASEIVKSMGGDYRETARRAASSFDYIFHFIQLPDKSKKRLKGIYEMCYDRNKDEIIISSICNYDNVKETWIWTYCISQDKESLGMEESVENFESFRENLKILEGR